METVTNQYLRAQRQDDGDRHIYQKCMMLINILRLKQIWTDGADDIFNCIFATENICIFILSVFGFQLLIIYHWIR